MLKKLWDWLLRISTIKKLALALLFIIPVVVYVYKFRHFTISDNPSDWADFGSYIGGIYTVVVTIFAIYLTRHLENKDLERKKAKAAIGSIFEQISKIDCKNVNMTNVNKLLRLINQNELYLPHYMYDRLLDLHDDYVVAKEEPQKFDLQKEKKIKQQLKRLYDS